MVLWYAVTLQVCTHLKNDCVLAVAPVPQSEWLLDGDVSAGYFRASYYLRYIIVHFSDLHGRVIEAVRYNLQQYFVRTNVNFRL
jgi:hypothetical protein